MHTIKVICLKDGKLKYPETLKNIHFLCIIISLLLAGQVKCPKVPGTQRLYHELLFLPL